MNEGCYLAQISKKKLKAKRIEEVKCKTQQKRKEDGTSGFLLRILDPSSLWEKLLCREKRSA